MEVKGNLQANATNEIASYVVDTGAADAYAVALRPAITAYTTGLKVRFQATNANTGASTLAVNGLAATPLKKNVSVALSAGDIPALGIIEAIYDGTNFQMYPLSAITGAENGLKVTALKARLGGSNLVEDTTIGLDGFFFSINNNLGKVSSPFFKLDGATNIFQFGALDKWTIVLDGNNMLFKFNGSTAFTFNYNAGTYTIELLGGLLLGLGISPPLSNLDVGGSFGTKYRKVSADNDTPDVQDYTLSVDNGASNWTIIPPNANTCLGRIYVIKRYDNNSTGTITIDPAGGNIQDPYDGSVNATAVIGGGYSQCTPLNGVAIQSNGTYWEVIGTWTGYPNPC